MAQATHVKVTGTWQKIKSAHVKVSGVWQKIKTIYVRVAGTWQKCGPALSLPVGVVLPAITASTPSGWSLESLQNGYNIIGASASKARGTSNAGTSSLAVSGSTSSAGGHAPASPFYLAGGCGVGEAPPCPYVSGNSTSGAHTHTLSGNLTTGLQDLYYTMKLFRCTVETSEIPAEFYVMSHTALDTASGGFNEMLTTINRLVRASTTVSGTNGGSSQASGTISTNTTGAHQHGSLGGGADDCFEASSTKTNVSAGAHAHSTTLYATHNTKKRKLSFWGNNAQSFGVVPGMIALWRDSDTPPAGWAICDGTNGTPDMRDYYLAIATGAGDRGVASGNNLVTASGTTPASANHTHQGSSICYQSQGKVSSYHISGGGGHTHTFSQSGLTITQPYYAMHFIMKLA